MPAVNLPPQPSSGNVTLKPVLKYQVRLLVSITVVILGLFFLLVALVSRSRRKYKFPSSTPPSQPGAAAVNQQTLWLSEKSCGINPSHNNMSSNQTSRHSSLKLERDTDEAQIDETGKKYQGHIDREGPHGGVSPPSSTGPPIPANHRSLLPPPPPLTPPTLSASPISFQTRQLSDTVSTMGGSEHHSAHHQSSGHSVISLSKSNSTALPNVHGSPSTPRRRSYTKALAITPSHLGSATEEDEDTSYFAPSSFPSSSPSLPPAPLESLEPKEINVKGEIISVTDDSGAGWKRHTRVYGGGVCHACQRSGGNHGAHGGFYGENVPLDQRR